VFGKTLVVRNLEVGAQMARESSLNCITMDGTAFSLSVLVVCAGI
jgi:hypothetical protein